MKIRFILTCLLTLGVIFSHLQAQNDDPVLFTVNGTPVQVSEFTYIYEKTNGNKADYSKRSLEEYLDLYVKFKLKVEKAKELQLDTIPALQKELEGYRRQLADSYLIDKEVTEKLIREAYERSQQDVDISHIVIAVSPDAKPADTLAAYNRALEIKQWLKEGASFDSLAMNYSIDKSAKRNKGHVGYVSALFPPGFYALETAAYNMPLNVLSDPIRTNAGYHLLKIHDRRPARGEIEIAHILIRKPEEGEAKDPKARIEEIYRKLQEGANFEELAKAESEDARTASKGGYLGTFGINRYEKDFEDAAFSIEEDGGYSDPFESSIGWHVIKRISKRDLGPYNVARGKLQAEVKRDPRFEKAKKAMIEDIKEQNNFMAFNTTLNNFVDTLGADFLSFKWKAPEGGSDELLFAFGKQEKVSLGEFMEFLEKSRRNRVRMARGKTPKDAALLLYEDFIDQRTLQFEERQLDKKYPEFKALMREYEEGILLFEATKMLVWDKASQDSAGLAEFFKTVSHKYKWKERARTSVYSLNSLDTELLEEVRKFAKKNPPAKVLAKFNEGQKEPLLEHGTRLFEKDRARQLRNMPWEIGAMSKPEVSTREQTQAFFKIEEFLPAANKTLEEAKGYVIADYQDHLEKKWVKELEAAFKVKVNKDVLNDMVR